MKTPLCGRRGALRQLWLRGGAGAAGDQPDHPGKKKIVGITGRSGSGKSTLLRLLMRFWDVQTGSIRFGAEDIRRVNTAALRAHRKAL